MSDAEPLTGEPLALDLVNTRPATEDGRADLLDTPERLAAWVARQPALHVEAGDAAPTAADLAPVHAAREQVDAVVRALLGGGRPPEAALRGLTEAQRAAPAVRELAWDGATVTATARRDGGLGVRLAARLAEAAADLLTDPAIGRLKECEADGCVMLFLPAHPRRRWCSPTRCGNRARVARYYQRQKSRTERSDTTN
ncbi:putative RNA-binding Zn ribbon-like protein [Saccharothrix coeruleofusca]|uniref:CGNR zinc finger domain-containing protein n=1 Tax=Saccharothrix coeruleofusca TaxID=33919 RepID=UPI001AE54062|nr:ABATE domain-containing protein [Saccharothrix coeruleofusca]MBP2340641.1 putative RNA-binding Zn ribbon-like protein [Saccharothrix coeruleofusca]